MHIFAISGGDIRYDETINFDKFNLELVGKSKVNVLFIPTASNDALPYCESIESLYGKKFGCNVDNLLLINNPPTDELINEKISTADIIYVGGGNTLSMMRYWKKYNLDTKFKNLSNTDKILTGLSAGAICWHEFGHSDSRKSKNSDYIKVKALGLKSGMFCPHMDTEKREQDFIKKLENSSVFGLGCDEKTALWYSDDNRVFVKTNEANSKVKLFTKNKGKLIVEEFGNNSELRLTHSST